MNQSKTGASLSSTTRLSASAKPFTINRCTLQPSLKLPDHSGQEPALYSADHCNSDPFGSLLDSFPKFNLGSKSNSVVPSSLGDSGFAREVATVTFPIDTASRTQTQTQTQDEALSQHLSVDLQGNGDFVVLSGSDFDMFKDFSSPVYCSDITGLGYGTCQGNELNCGKQGKDYHGSLFDTRNDDGGKHALDGLDLYEEASDRIYSKGADLILVEDKFSNSRGKMQVGAISSSVLTSNSDDAPFISSTSDMSFAAKLNNIPHSKGGYTTSVVTYSNFVSTGASDEHYFSKVPSSVSNVASDSIGNQLAGIHGSSSACSVFLPFDSTKNMDFLAHSCRTIDDKDCSSSNMSGTKDSFVILNADGKGTDDGNKEKQKKIGKSVSLDATEYSANTQNEVILKSNSTRGDVSIKTSKNLGDSDSDLDSPCWKGTMTSSQTHQENLGSVHLHYFEKEVEKCNTLNPLAPQFVPSNAQGSSYPGGRKAKDDFVSFKSGVPFAVNVVSGEDKQMKTVMAEAHPIELKEGVQLLPSNDVYKSEKAFNFVNDPKCSFLLNSTCMTQPVSIEDCSTMKRTIVTAMDVEGCPKETKDAMARGSISGSFPTKCHSPISSSSSSQAFVVTDLYRKLQGVSKSLSDSPKLDVQRMVDAMHVLSELIVQTCAHGLDSYREYDHDTVQHIMNNLNVFSTSYSGQMIPTHQSTHTGSQYFLGRSSELPKHSRRGIEGASIETFAVPKRLHNQNNNGGQNTVAKVIAERGQCSLSSTSDVGAEKGNEIVQVIRRNLGKSQDMEEHLPPQAVLYKNLWLDAEAALCYMRRKIYTRLMEIGMDVNQTDFVDLLR